MYCQYMPTRYTIDLPTLFNWSVRHPTCNINKKAWLFQAFNCAAPFTTFVFDRFCWSNCQVFVDLQLTKVVAKNLHKAKKLATQNHSNSIQQLALRFLYLFVLFNCCLLVFRAAYCHPNTWKKKKQLNGWS